MEHGKWKMENEKLKMGALFFINIAWFYYGMLLWSHGDLGSLPVARVRTPVLSDGNWNLKNGIWKMEMENGKREMGTIYSLSRFTRNYCVVVTWIFRIAASRSRSQGDTILSDAETDSTRNIITLSKQALITTVYTGGADNFFVTMSQHKLLHFWSYINKSSKNTRHQTGRALHDVDGMR